MKPVPYLLCLVLALGVGCAGKKSKQAAAAAAASETPYLEPLSTPGYRFSNLPAEVRSTVLAEAGMTEIVDVEREAHDGRLIYKIYFRDSNNFPPLYVGADGSVLTPDLHIAVRAPPQPVTLEFTDLPTNIVKIVRERQPEAEVSSVLREPWGDQTVYVVSFRYEARYPKLYIVSDGVNAVQGR